MQYQIPLDLAHRLRNLGHSPIWAVLLDYLEYRQGQLNNLLFSEQEEDTTIVKRTMKASGGKTELYNLRNLPELAEDICQAEAKHAEALDRRT
jgi:hypothetical protein